MLKHYLSLFLLIAISILGYRHGISTAYELPTMDMMPFLERYYNPDFVKSDFYTNSFSEPNPRYLWGYFLIGITELLGLSPNWYQAVFILKISFLLLYPIAFYYLLTEIYQRFETDDFKNVVFQIISVFFIYLIVHYEYIINPLFTVAWWKPYNEVMMPQTLSLFLGILAIVLIDRKYPVFYLFLFLSTCFHLSIGVLFALIACISISKISIRNTLLVLFISVVLPAMALTTLFGSDIQLSNKEFVKIYAFDIHSPHYIPSDFGNLIYSSYIIALVVSVLFLLSAVIGVMLSNRFILISSVISLFVYAGGILLQYLCVEIVPVKLMAILGPSRYTFLGYWMLVFVYGSILTDVLLRLITKYTNPFLTRLKALFLYLDEKYVSKFYLVACGCTVACFFISNTILTKNIDNPRGRYNTPVLTWIRDNTPQDAVIMAPENIDLGSILYISNRAVFTWQGLPFNEKFMKEAVERHNRAFGSYEQRKKIKGRWIGDQHEIFYRSHSPQYFKTLSLQYKIDYVVIEVEHNQAFGRLKPVYRDNFFYIYSIKDL